MRCGVHGASVWGPGLAGWAASEALLAAPDEWPMAEVPVPVPTLLSPTERRRAGTTTRFALAAAEDATAGEADRAALETIFASANGDGATVSAMLDALHERDVALSPTQFHNSVHNAAAGYWHIAVASTRPSVSLGGHDAAFAAGLLLAMTAVAARGVPVLLCAYDVPLPEPLAAVRPTAFPFAAAFVLRPMGTPGARATLTLAHDPLSADAPGCNLAAGNPAARALPLLRALAARRAATLTLPMTGGGHLRLEVAPC